MTWNDISYLCPVEYKLRHFNSEMQEKSYRMQIGDEWRTFRFICKVDRDFAPRELSKLKDRIDLAVSYLCERRPLDLEVVFTQLINNVYPSQKVGMGKLKRLKITISNCFP